MVFPLIILALKIRRLSNAPLNAIKVQPWSRCWSTERTGDATNNGGPRAAPHWSNGPWRTNIRKFSASWSICTATTSRSSIRSAWCKYKLAEFFFFFARALVHRPSLSWRVASRPKLFQVAMTYVFSFSSKCVSPVNRTSSLARLCV